MKNKMFIKYILIAILSFLIDIVLFKIFNTIFFNFNNNIIYATIIARIISSLFNYKMNKGKVFKSNNKNTLIKYYILVVVAMLVSAFTVKGLHNIFSNIDAVIIKLPVEAIIFVGNYFIQKFIIFKNK